MPSVYLFSAPIRSGKTSALMHWASGREGVAGILCPDVDGRRMLYDITTGAYHALEAPEAQPGLTTSVGRFHFWNEGFRQAREILMRGAQTRAGWLIIDEVGKLELQGEGLAPAVSTLLNYYRQPGRGRLLLVVRDSLLDAARQYYQLPEHETGVWQDLCDKD